MIPIRNVLHATDFSDNSRTAFGVACAVARDYGAQLVVVHVMPPPLIVVPDGVTLPLTDDDIAEVRQRLERMHCHGVAVRHVLAEGPPAQEILAAAADAKADLIVMGTHGRGGLTRLLMGSVAEHVMRQANCPVLTVKSPSKDRHESPETQNSERQPSVLRQNSGSRTEPG